MPTTFGLSFEGRAFKSRLVVPEKACGGLPPLFLAFFDHCGAVASPYSALRRRHISPNEHRSSFS
ncbi:MAG: hypothetical protein UHH95_05940 [Oscillospiraceae bacterium]|nr:hypothetical protein [Oscillospiraceae bacterium]